MGQAFCFGDDIDTDQIIPAQHITSADPTALANHCMEGADPTFADCVTPGDVLVAGSNFGCGSSREHAPLAILGTGVDAVIAESFARIFFRNAINIGLPVLTVSDATDRMTAGDDVEVHIEDFIVEDRTTDDQMEVNNYSDFVNEIMEEGGLIEYGKTLSQSKIR